MVRREPFGIGPWLLVLTAGLIVMPLSRAGIAPAVSSGGGAPARPGEVEEGPGGPTEEPIDLAGAMCESGGPGARMCATEETISYGGVGETDGCGVTCQDGFFACCRRPKLLGHASCQCVEEPKRGPWTPETP